MPSDIILKDSHVEVLGGIVAKKSETARPFLSVTNTAASAQMVLGGGPAGAHGQLEVRDAGGKAFLRVVPGICHIGSNTITLKSGSRVRLETSGVVLELGPSEIRVTRTSGGRRQSFDLIKALESIDSLQRDVQRLKARL